MLLQPSMVNYFSVLCSIPLYESITSHSTVLLWLGVRDVSRFKLL